MTNSEKKFNPKPPKILDNEQLEQLEALSSFLTIPQIADYFMIGARTFNRIIDRQPEAMARYKKGKSRAIVNVAKSLMSQIRDGEVAATIFFLKTQAGWSERNADQDETTPPPAKITIKAYDGRKPASDTEHRTES